jgi:hypothetical protein
MDGVTIERQIAAVRDEISKRKRLYPRWVKDGRMTQAEADDRIACMQAVRETLERLNADQEARKAPGLDLGDWPLPAQ